MKQRGFLYSKSAMVIAFLFLLFSFSGNVVSGLNNEHTNFNDAQNTYSCSAHRLAEVVCSEELLPLNQARIISSDSLRKPNQPKFFDCSSNGSTYLLISADILYLKAYLLKRKVSSTNRFIIKYIHDQDGHKILSPFY